MIEKKNEVVVIETVVVGVVEGGPQVAGLSLYVVQEGCDRVSNRSAVCFVSETGFQRKTRESNINGSICALGDRLRVAAKFNFIGRDENLLLSVICVIKVSNGRQCLCKVHPILEGENAPWLFLIAAEWRPSLTNIHYIVSFFEISTRAYFMFASDNCSLCGDIISHNMKIIGFFFNHI